MNNTTVNTIIEIFRSISERHSMIQSFGFGPTFNISTNQATRYPLLWVEQSPSTVQRQNGMIVAYYSFSVYVMDKLDKGDSNYNDVVSDTDFILNTIVAELGDSGKYRELGIVLQDTVTKEPVTTVNNTDNAEGWMADMSFKVVLPLNSCSIPVSSCDC